MPRETRIHARACARLHLGFLDLAGALDRQFGSLGVALEDVSLALMAMPAPEITATGPGAERVASLAREFMSAGGVQGGIRIAVQQAIPEHAGLGSGTQLALAVGSVCSRMADLGMDTPDIASLLCRGRRSGIGIGTFMHGGFIVDGGRGPGTRIPPVVSRLAVPEDWRFVLVLDRSMQGAHGERESEAFASLPSMDAGEAGRLCHLTLLHILPALAEGDCARFGRAVGEIQAVMGRLFSHPQRGPYTSRVVGTAVRSLQEHGACGGGQSSWGPTGFAIFPSQEAAERAMDAVRQGMNDNLSLHFVSCRAANHPAVIRVDAANRQAHG